MSRIGLKPILLPKGVALTPGEGMIAVQGPKGKLNVPLPGGITLAVVARRLSPAGTIARRSAPYTG